MFRYVEYQTYPVPPILLEHCDVTRRVPETIGDLMYSYKEALVCIEQSNNDKDHIKSLTNSAF